MVARLRVKSRSLAAPVKTMPYYVMIIVAIMAVLAYDCKSVPVQGEKTIELLGDETACRVRYRYRN